MALTQVPASMQESNAQYTGFKNRIINGAMMIDQRNAGASVSYGGGTGYSVDRFLYESSNTAVSLQQVSDAPAGFKTSLKWTTTTGGSLVAGSYADIQQHIEGYNFADFNYGTASAAPMTISFWVKSSLTGTFSICARLTNGVNVGYITTYTINAANTWEYKTITVPGNTVNAPASSTNGYSLTLNFILGVGSTYQTASLNTWGSAAVTGYGGASTASTAMITTTGATWQVTGVQLEKGSTATSFDYRPYGTELALCQRYCIRSAGYLGTSYSGAVGTYGAGVSAGNWMFAFGSYPVPMRASPTLSISDYAGTVGKITLWTSSGGATTNGITPYTLDTNATGFSFSDYYNAKNGLFITGYLASAEL